MIVRASTLAVQIILYFIQLIQVLADDDYTSMGFTPALNFFVELFAIFIIVGVNAYLIFLYFYWSKNGMDLHLRFKENEKKRELMRKQFKQSRGEAQFDEFGNQIPGGAPRAGEPAPHREVARRQAPDDYEQQQIQMAIAASQGAGGVE